MNDVVWAEATACRLLKAELPGRWRHVCGVAARTEVVRWSASRWGDLLPASAWLHDIGYASPLVDTGFHPIDGARHLRRLGTDERLVNLVAHHSCARVEAGLRDLDDILVDEFPRDDSLPHDELCFCDITTSPDGELVTVEERLAEIRQRYGPGHVVSRFVDLAEPELVAIVRRVEAQLAGPDEPRNQPR